MSNPAGGEFTLVIAGTAVSVRCDVAALAARLAERYARHLDARVALLQIEIRWTGYLRQDSRLDVGLELAGGCARFTAAGYQGQIDLSSGQAWLELSARQPVEEVDYFLRVCYALLVFEQGGLLLHAAGIQRAGRSYLFFGHSGAGKTTIARLSAQLPQTSILNDDLVIVMPGETGYLVYATPFWNPTQVPPDIHQQPQAGLPLTGLYRLVQASQVHLEALEAGKGLAELISNVPVIPADPQRNPALLERLGQLNAQVPVKALHFLPDASFWQFIHPEPVLRSP
ncbi:MAG: hypothetical protein JW862_15245 [Anaerolineales bacterium]|nr:hypothetical protein [Anaerolineales bacterium]